MNYKIINLHVRADLESILKTNPNGSLKDYILKDSPITKSEKIIFLASVINIFKLKEVYIETKYSIGRRNKRIEICFLENKILFLGKISNAKEFDKDSIEMDSLISDIINKLSLNSLSISGLIFVGNKYNSRNINEFKKSLQNNFLFLPFDPDNQIEIIKNGLFNK